jgi:hypothetical protein
MKRLQMYDSWGNPVSLTSTEIEVLLREFNDDDTPEFQVTSHTAKPVNHPMPCTFPVHSASSR